MVKLFIIHDWDRLGPNSGTGWIPGNNVLVGVAQSRRRVHRQ